MVNLAYSPHLVKADLIGPIRHWDFYFLTGAPHPTKDYLTLIKPFEPIVWAFVLASAVAVSIALISINKMYATWSNKPLKESAFQSRNE